MKKILAFGGSTSSTSINKQLATYAASLLNNVEVDILDMNDYTSILFSVDEEKNGFPKIIQVLNEKFKSTDGFVISLAEHNGSYASAYKNTIDWLSRVERKVFKDKPVLLMASSPGGRGGASVLEDAKAYYPKLGAEIVATFSLAKFYDTFKEGKIIDEALDTSLKEAVSNFEASL
jgi:NAD(P)H-dependent FMN reductase